MKKLGKSDPDAGFLKDNPKDWMAQNFKKNSRKDLRRRYFVGEDNARMDQPIRVNDNSLVDQCELTASEGRLVVFEQVSDFLLTLLHEGRPFESGV